MDVVQLPPQGADARVLVLRRLPLVPQERSVQIIGVLADALFAGDRPALLGGDDLPPHLFELLTHGRKPRHQGVTLRQLPRPFRRALLRRVDAIDQRAHVAEQRHHLERRVVVLAPVIGRVRGPPVERDLDARLHGLVAFAQPHGVRPGHHARTARAPVRHRRRAGDAGRLVLHRPRHPVQPPPRARRDGVDELPLAVQHLQLDGPIQVPRALVVRDQRAARRVLADERGIALRPAAARKHALLRWPSGNERHVLRQQLVRERAQGRQVVDDPDAASVRRQHQIAVAGMDLEIAHRHARELAAAELRPVPASVHGDEESQLGSEEEQVLLQRVLLDHVRITAQGSGWTADAHPCLPEVLRAVHPRRHVPEVVPVERRVRRSRLEAARLDPRDPARFRQAGDVSGDVGPVPSPVPGELDVAVVGADPDGVRVARGLADHGDGRVGLRRGVVDGDAARLFLALLLRIVGGEIGRDALPRVAAIPGTEEELRRDVDDALLRRARGDGRVPVEAQLLLVQGLRLHVARRHRPAIDAPDEAALRFDVDRLRIGGIGHCPEAVTAVEVLPAPVADSAAVSGVADPGAVVLQPAVDVVGVRSVEGHVIELRDRKVLLLPPPVPAVEGLPEPAVVAADDVLRILRVDPEIVPVAVRSSAGVGEAATPILADDQVEVRLEEAVGIGGIDDQPREVEGPPDHGLTAIERSPLGAAVVGAVERGMLGFDERVDALR